MVAPSPRRAAPHADDVALAGHALTELQPAHGCTDLDDLARIFVADDHRHGDRLFRPIVPVPDVDVGPADAGLRHLHQDFVGADFGDGLVLQPKPGLRLWPSPAPACHCALV